MKPSLPTAFRRVICLLGLAFILTACPAIRESTGPTSYDPVSGLRYENHSYQGNIKTIQLYREGLEESYPVLYMGRNENLVLSFDELMPQDQRESEFRVDLISCDADWNPSNLIPIEFYEGFLNQQILDFQRSAFTKVPYVHYEYRFPKEGEFFKMSGNYLLKVYREANTDNLVLTRRFVVVEQKIPIQLKYELSKNVIRQQMENFSFEINGGNLPIFNPANDLKVRVLQNFRWNSALYNLEPRFQNDKRYEYFVDVLKSYTGGNEFRRHESESINLYGRNVQDIEERENINDLYIFPDAKRDRNTYGSRRDRNGSYAVRVSEFRDNEVNADYLRNHFYVKSNNKLEGEVYVFGELTDWQTKPEFQMTYNESLRRYEGEFLLKQGIYDYYYVQLEPGASLVYEPPFEGIHTHSENFYSILVYFRYPTDRNDRLMGFQPINYRE